MTNFRFTVLEPESCEGCGLCCEGIGSPPAIYTYRTSYSGPYLFRPKDLPFELAQELDRYFGGLRHGEEPLAHCLWFDPATRQCKHYQWRPQVCRQYDMGCDSCLKERRPYLVAPTSPSAQDSPPS